MGETLLSHEAHLAGTRAVRGMPRGASL